MDFEGHIFSFGEFVNEAYEPIDKYSPFRKKQWAMHVLCAICSKEYYPNDAPKLTKYFNGRFTEYRLLLINNDLIGSIEAFWDTMRNYAKWVYPSTIKFFTDTEYAGIARPALPTDSDSNCYMKDVSINSDKTGPVKQPKQHTVTGDNPTKNNKHVPFEYDDHYYFNGNDPVHGIDTEREISDKALKFQDERELDENKNAYRIGVFENKVMSFDNF